MRPSISSSVARLTAYRRTYHQILRRVSDSCACVYRGCLHCDSSQHLAERRAAARSACVQARSHPLTLSSTSASPCLVFSIAEGISWSAHPYSALRFHSSCRRPSQSHLKTQSLASCGEVVSKFRRLLHARWGIHGHSPGCASPRRCISTGAC